MAQAVTLTLPKTCAACGKERKSKALKYDPKTFEPYCDNPYICNDKHPNSTPNIIERRGEAPLITADEANEAYKAHLLDVYEDKSVVEQIQRMLTSPTTVRILEPAMAKFLIDFAQERSYTSQSEALRECVRIVMENKGQFINEYREAVVEQKKEDVAADVVSEIEGKKPKKEEPKDADSFGVF